MIVNIYLSLDNIFVADWVMQLLNNYERFGPLLGIFLPFIEAFLPFLPLIVFVFANTYVYGLLYGFLYSWIGSSLGSIAVFLIIRYLGEQPFFRKLKNNQHVRQVTARVERHGFGPLFILLCFPFTPSSIINVVAGLSKVSIRSFSLAVAFGKSVMIFSIAYVGENILSFAQNPKRTMIVTISMILFWLIGKYIEKRLLKQSQA